MVGAATNVVDGEDVGGSVGGRDGSAIRVVHREGDGSRGGAQAEGEGVQVRRGRRHVHRLDDNGGGVNVEHIRSEAGDGELEAYVDGELEVHAPWRGIVVRQGEDHGRGCHVGSTRGGSGVTWCCGGLWQRQRDVTGHQRTNDHHFDEEGARGYWREDRWVSRHAVGGGDGEVRGGDGKLHVHVQQRLHRRRRDVHER